MDNAGAYWKELARGVLTFANSVVYCQQVARGRHPKKEVAQALEYAEEHGWDIEMTSGGHRWGVARCGQGCSLSIWSTPKNAGNHAKDIWRAVDRCPHRQHEEESDG